MHPPVQHKQPNNQQVHVRAHTSRQWQLHRPMAHADLEHERVIPVAADHGVATLHQHMMGTSPLNPPPRCLSSRSPWRGHRHSVCHRAQQSRRQFPPFANTRGKLARGRNGAGRAGDGANLLNIESTNVTPPGRIRKHKTRINTISLE